MEGHIWFPRLHCVGYASLLVDTGADRSLISREDALRLAVPYNLLVREDKISGIGGDNKVHLEGAVLAFAEQQGVLHFYSVEIGVLEDDPGATSVPSILGRDILDRWRMDYHPSGGVLQFEVVSSDRSATL